MRNRFALIALGLAFLVTAGVGAAQAADVLWFLGHSGYDEGHTQIFNLLQTTEGATIDEVTTTPLPTLTGYNLIFIVMPGFTNGSDYFTADEKARLNAWLTLGSHRVVMVGDWDGFYNGQAVMNDLLAAIGNPIVFVPGAYDSGCGHCLGPMGVADPLTAGLAHLCYGLTPTWDPTYGAPLAYPEDPSAPGPWVVSNGTNIPCIVGIGDQNGLTDPCGYMQYGGGDSDSQTFARRLYRVTCAGDPQWACCLPDGTCQMLTQADCARLYGTWYNNSNCSQIQCAPVPVETGSWGHIKSRFH
jgi:hypothetical protein